MTKPPQGSPQAVAVAFSAAGLSMASALSRVPQIKIQVGATATELAFALVCVGIGSVLTMPLAGRLVHRWSSGVLCRWTSVLALAGWAAVPLVHSVPALAVLLLVTGMGVGLWDVGMNVQASEVERRRRRVVMPILHALFSVGAVIGALAGAGAANLDIPLGWQLPVVSAVLVIAVQVAVSWFIPDHAGAAEDRAIEGATTELIEATPPDASSAELAGDRMAESDAAPARSGITRVEILLGLITLGTALGEGAANDWLALALVQDRGAPAAVGALTYAGFNLTMAIGRFVGGPFITRFGRVTALRSGGLLASAGILTLCLVPGAGFALLGAGAWGLGLAVVFPSGMSAAGEVPGRGPRAIATVATIGYGGFLLGSPAIGLLAHVMPLLRALLVVAAVVLIIVVLAPAARERTPQRKTIAVG